eukprot:g12079.t1
MHKNRDYYYVTCRVLKPRKEAQVKPRAMMLRRRRIAKAKAIVGQLLGEAHGFTDAEVEEFTCSILTFHSSASSSASISLTLSIPS